MEGLLCGKTATGLSSSGSHAHSQKEDVNLKEDTKLEHSLAREVQTSTEEILEEGSGGVGRL